MIGKRTPYLVEYEGGFRAARFSNHEDAQTFAASRKGGAEVIDTRKTGGIVGQWIDGEPSGEFPHLSRFKA